ncbi:MAG: hypothetical protein ACREMZ_12885 [Gemmatimonadales bacterium]
MSSKTTADKVSQAEARLQAVQAEQQQLATREPQLQARAEQISARDLPAAEQAHNLARVTIDPKDDVPAGKAVAALKTELANCESTLKGFAVRRQQLALAEAAAVAAVQRAKAAAELVKAREHGAVVEEMFTDAFDALGALVAGSIRPAIAQLNPDDRRGVAQAFDEGALARWIIAKCSQAGVSITREQLGLMHLPGNGPADTAANVVAIVEML